MHVPFLTVVIVVAVIGLTLSVTRLAWPFSVMQRLGRTGSWMHHEDMDALEHRRDTNLNDPSIPRRPLRSHR